MVNSHDDFFSNRQVVLTGAGRRGQTGEIIAREFAMHGARMILVDRNPENVAERVADLRGAGFDADGFSCDLSVEEEVASVAEKISALCGDAGLCALVNAAGGFHMSGNVADSSLEVWRNMFTVNLMTAYLVTRALLPVLRTGRGAIVNFATGSALPGHGVAKMSAYVAAKSGLIALTRAVAQEERNNAVRANAIAPSTIRTASNLKSMGPETRYIERETVAQTVLFLCSPAAAAISGEVIRLA